MKKYRLDAEKFADFLAGVVCVFGLIAIAVWFMTHCIW